MKRSTNFGIFLNSKDSSVTYNIVRRNRHILIGFCAVLAFAWFCYQPAVSGAFQFDDEFNLRGLAEIDDAQSAFNYIFSGISGPTGRPLALASFALQAEHWEQGASAFLRVNILIHLVNAALLAFCLYQLSLQRAVGRSEAALVAAGAAGLWVLMPLLATASLFVVQRMTTLSAMFMLLGLSGYLFARAKVHNRPKQALAGMSASLVAGAVFATLCKESGALLPIFVLVLEVTVLERPSSVKDRDWRIWQFIFLVSPLVLLLVYLGSWLDYPDALLASREFDAWERLLTESRVLWIYLLKALVGIPNQLGIYQDVPTLSRSLFNPATFLACFAWLALLLASVAWRRRYPLFAVAVLWYLGGHLIESTVVPLELYFEHRNYLPVIGPLFALSSFLCLRPVRDHRIAGVLIPLLMLVNAWFLYSFSTLSGQPSFAARYWAATYPESQRAVARMARYQLAEEGPERAIETIDKFLTANPEHAYLRIPVLKMMCEYSLDQDQGQVVDQLHRELPDVEFTYSSAVMLFELFKTASGSNCKDANLETVVSLATTLRGNSRYMNEPLYNQAYQKLLAAIARQQGDYDAVIGHLQRAITHRPGEDLNQMMVAALLHNRKFDAARDFIDDAESLAPAHPVKAMMWQRDLDGLREYIRKVEQNEGTPPRG
jgi:tetratricopeptide (TPR) repeat protein